VPSFNLPQNAWFGDEEITITLPDDWEVAFAGIPADEHELIDKKVIVKAIRAPLSSRPLAEQARERSKAVIIFDDLSRPTAVSEIAPLVVDELLDGGMAENKISFVAALGAHGAHNRLDFEKKLGKDLVRKYPVYNHNPYENCTYAGKTRFGTPLYINSEVMKADLKIGIGCILPHAFNGFGGGGKIILPGVAGMESITLNHKKVLEDLKERGVGFIGNMGNLANSKMKEEIEDALKAVQLDFLINVLPNSSRKPVEIFCGSPPQVFKNGVEKARKLYRSDFYRDADIVIANANAKASEALIAMLLSANSLKEEGGDLVTVINCPVGQIVHYLFGRFGESTGGQLWSEENLFPPRIKRSIIYSKCGGQRFGLQEDAIECEDWSEVLSLLREKNGPGSKVVIFKDGTMQYLDLDS